MRIILSLLLAGSALFAAGEHSNRRAPGFSLVDYKGQQHDLYDYRGKVVLLEFMQTTCPHCAGFAGVLEQVQQKYGDRVAILAIVNPPDTQQKIAQFATGHGVKYPVMWDSGQVAYSYVQAGSLDLPQVYLIDAEGMIRNDFAYSVLTRDIFEGKGLYPEIDKLLAAPAQKKK